MEIDCQRNLARLQVFGHQDGDFDLMLANLLEVCLVDVERIEASGRCGVVIRRHS